MRFDTLLIANRGEIAVRIARSARTLGLRTVAVYSDVDRGAPHVAACDTSVALGPAAASESYLVTERILAAAQATGAGAIHPGYGFLSENAAFAKACHEAEIVFVGPPAGAIGAMGDKATSKRLMRDAGVPVVPGYDGEGQDDALLIAEAAKIGFPIMVKASAGGGGKGMRLVQSPGELVDALAAARREALNAFGSDVLLLERAVLRPRHVEIQILADAHGNVISLGERDCSVQRRHQKVLEESPSPAVDDDLRTRMGHAAVAAARAVDYVGAGTVEFLLSDQGEFFFLEMNTRLQVEHPVTEMVTGIDLVAWQLRVAQGAPLDLTQDGVTVIGHAIEARLYAEDPANDYLPATGTIGQWHPPTGAGVRVDAGVRLGSVITPHYDPMIAKIIAHGDTREQARVRLLRALEETVVAGPTTNRAMLIAALDDPAFASSNVTTAFLDDHRIELPDATTQQLAALVALRYERMRAVAANVAHGIAGWSSAGESESRQVLRIGDDDLTAIVRETRNGVTVDIDGTTHAVTLGDRKPTIDGVTVSVDVYETDYRVLATFDRLDLEALDLAAMPAGLDVQASAGTLTAPMHGMVISTAVDVGAQVRAGDTLLLLEAMKMEHEIAADIDGVVDALVSAGTQVTSGQLLVQITPG